MTGIGHINCDIPIWEYYITMKNDAIGKKECANIKVFCISGKELWKYIKETDKIGYLLERQRCDCGQKLEGDLFFKLYTLFTSWILKHVDILPIKIGIYL